MFNFMINKLRVVWLSVAFLVFCTPGYADDITVSINEALQYYKDGKYTDAVESLNYASRLIQQKKGEFLESFLPQPLSGWTAESATSESAGAAMFGGGVATQRQYRKGSSSVLIQIITDSPLLQGVMMMFSNPMFAASDGGKLERIGGEKAIVKFDPANKNGEIKIVVANRFLVSIEGTEVTREDLKGYASTIDYKKMASIP